MLVFLLRFAVYIAKLAAHCYFMHLCTSFTMSNPIYLPCIMGKWGVALQFLEWANTWRCNRDNMVEGVRIKILQYDYRVYSKRLAHGCH
jgi:hypothetical protein